MIKHLHIENYAIIDELDLPMQSGFSVFTGETGAGKSIIIGALSYLFGVRCDKSIISHGANSCIIEGIFEVSSSMSIKLKQAEIEYEDNEVIIRRTITEDRSGIRINQRAVTLSFLQELFQGECDIHSQRDNQYLLKTQNHLSLLDNYASHTALLNSFLEAYQDYKNTSDEFKKMLEEDFNEKEIDFLRYNLQELTQANIRVGEEEELLQTEKRLKSSEKLLKAINDSLNLYHQENGIDENLYQLQRNLEIHDEELNKIAESVQDLRYALDEEMEKINYILHQFETGDDDLNSIEERLYQLNRLKRKFNTNEEGLLAEIHKIEEKLSYYEHREKFLQQQKQKLRAKEDLAKKLAQELSISRKKAANFLQKEVIEQLHDLLLPNAQFIISQQETELTADGIDNIEFLISMNKGETLRPLVKVASGGELSRLMLGLKTIFTRLSSVQLCIFDEIDAGVSGKVALAMGKKMYTIAKNTQVLAITHLASVAACGQQHYYIYKKDDAQKTHTYIRKLTQEERVNELMRISGNVHSKNALSAAKELLESAQRDCHEN